MKFAFSADIHLSRYSQDKVEDSSSLPERLHSIKSALYEIADYCIENGIKTVILGGDLLHGKSIIYAVAQEIMIEYFKKYGRDLIFYVLDGNHDLSGKGEDVVSALSSIQYIPGVNWIPFNSMHRIEDGDVLLVPYSYNVPNIVKENKARILVSHFGLTEGILNSGMSIISDVKVADLTGNYNLVLLGHYHKPQEITRDNFSLYYVGSPIQLDWGEKGEEKRFLVVDTDDLSVESVPIKSYKQHVEIFITEENKEEAIQQAKDAKEAGHHINIIKKEKVDLDEIAQDFHIVDKTEVDITDRGITSSMSNEDKLRRYLEIQDIDKEDLKEYEAEGFDIIQNQEG